MGPPKSTPRCGATFWGEEEPHIKRKNCFGIFEAPNASSDEMTDEQFLY